MSFSFPTSDERRAASALTALNEAGYDVEGSSPWLSLTIRTPENYAADLKWLKGYRTRQAFAATHTVDEQFAEIDRLAAKAQAVRS